MVRTRVSLLALELACWTLGIAGLSWWAVHQLWVASSTRIDVQRFTALRVTPDQSLWSATRVTAWRQAVGDPAPAPLAVLRIPKIRLEVALLPGTDDRTLDRGVGHIEGTAPPGTVGNLGIAGHRDGFFRGLKDLATGDLIELDTLHGTDTYRIERMWVVGPEEVSVLDPTSTPALTLVTCYPFYFVGSAPDRFIVRAVRAGDTPAEVRSTARGLWFGSFFQ